MEMIAKKFSVYNSLLSTNWIDQLPDGDSHMQVSNA